MSTHTQNTALESVVPVGLGWKVRERRDSDGELLDCFVEAPRADGMAYGLEVLGDDYTGYGGVRGKLEHCQVIVAWANAVSPVSAEPVAVPACPFHCGWDGLHKIAVQDAAYLAKVQWPEDEEGVSVPRATAMRSMDYLIQVCRTMLNSAPVTTQPDVTQQTLDDVMAGIPARDAEIAALRKEIETLQAAQAQQYVSGGNLADRLDVLADTASPGSQMQSDLYAAATIWRKHLKGPAAQQPVSGADDIEFLVRVLEQVSAWLPEDWSEFLERNPAVVDMLRPMVNHQTQQDADKVDAALAEMVHAMFRSGNSVPVTRITIDRKQYDAAIDAARKEQA